MISCLCITYSRVDLLEEAIESFLRQTYKGAKELIIINDCEDQVLHFDHPEVFILNIPRRVNTVGEKRDMSIALAKGNYFLHWDDDDICLPHRIEFSLNKLKENNLDYYKLNQAFHCSLDHKISSISVNQFYGCSIFTRELFYKTYGHGFINSGQDSYIEKRYKEVSDKRLIENTKISNVNHSDIFYLYRWGGVSVHLSQTGKSINPLGDIEKIKKSDKNRKTGDIILNPKWRTDYVKLTQDYLTTNKL